MSYSLSHTSALAGLLSCVALLSACGNGVPKCSDSETTDLVVQIAGDEFTKQVGAQVAKAVKWEVTSIRTTDENEKTGAFECAADMVVKGPGGEHKAPITYTVEKTDDGNFYVNVFGL